MSEGYEVPTELPGSTGLMYGLEKLGLFDQNGLERNLSALLLRTLVVGRKLQKSESIEAALDIE